MNGRVCGWVRFCVLLLALTLNTQITRRTISAQTVSKSTVLIVTSIAAQDAGVDLQKRTWTKVQYLGGALGVRGKVELWKNPLTVSPQKITLQIYKGPLIEIDPSRVTAIGYMGGVMSREGTAAAFGMVSPVAFFVIWAGAKSKSHYIGIDYLLPDNRKSGLLLRVDKDNYQEILEALKAVTQLADSK